MYPITENLKYIHIPQNKENYNEIMKLHFDIITMMEKAKQNLANDNRTWLKNIMHQILP